MKLPNIEIISASAGSGKTFALTSILEEEIGSGRVRPDSVLATTFTNKSAAELKQRVRTRLLSVGRGEDAQRLESARIGTVNSVCGQLVTDFAFVLGMSPELEILDEIRADAAVRQAMAQVVSAEIAAEFADLQARMEGFEWPYAVRNIVNQARANLLSQDALQESARRSIESLGALFGAPEERPSGAPAEAALKVALEAFVNGVDQQVDATDKTAKALDRAREALARLAGGGRLAWSRWLALADLAPGAKSKALAEPVKLAAAFHDRHPALRGDCARAIELCFDIARQTLAAYESYKRDLGAIDFVDQEVLALELLGEEPVRAQLRSRLDLVLVDEFQDTSPLQLSVFLALAPLAKRSVWVGDQKQCIYGFRGTDPALMDAVLEQLLGGREPKTLDRSYRSRPELVRVTSDLFVTPFAQQGIPPPRVRLEPAVADGPSSLALPFERWSLEAKNKTQDAQALAAGVSALLQDPSVKVRAGTKPESARAVRRGDVAVLCHMNDACQDVANALESLGIPAIVPRVGLLETLEASVVLSALRLFVDAGDGLAAAELARMLEFPADAEGFLRSILAKPGAESFSSHDFHQRIRAASDAHPAAGALEAFDAVLAALEMRTRCAAFGDADRRMANLDALRAHAATYAATSLAEGAACTPAGLVAHLESLHADAADSQALLGGNDAVVVSTWHRAKGLEWPVTVLFGNPPDGRALGITVQRDDKGFDLEDPLRGRWIRFWFSPYHAQQNKAPFHQRLDAHPATLAAFADGYRQKLRQLYVGWTRARDVLVLATRGDLNGGIFGLLADDAGEPLLAEPTPSDGDSVATVPWAAHQVRVRVRDVAPQPAAARTRLPGRVVPELRGRDVAYAPAYVSPSAPTTGAGEAMAVDFVGELLPVSGRPDRQLLGEALHGFFAVDREAYPHAQRVALAREQLEQWGVSFAVDPGGLVDAADNLIRWVKARFPGALWHREWPVQARRDSGTVVRGTADLLLKTSTGWIVVDHKSLTGRGDGLAANAAEFASQLGTYAEALALLSPEAAVRTFVHAPLAGAVIEVRVQHTAVDAPAAG